MTNTIVPGGSRPPPTPATKGAVHPTGTTGDDALGFLALLAILGPGNTGTPTAASDTTTTDATKERTNPVASTVRHRGKRDERDTDQMADASGVVRAHPILPAPIILGVPPAAGDGRNWRSDDPVTTTGAKGAHPILPDALSNQRAGDVLQMPNAGQSLGAASMIRGKGAGGDAADLTAIHASSNSVTQGGDGARAALSANLPPNKGASIAQGSATAPMGTLPLTSNLPLAATSIMPQMVSTPSLASAASANGAPSIAASGATKRRIGDSDSTASEAGAFAITDARLGNVSTTGGTAGTAATTAPTHPAAINATREIVAQAQLVGRGESAEMRLRLRPPDLGEVGVTIRRNAAGALTVHLNPASPEAAAVLRAHLPHLQTALEPHSFGQGAQVTLGQHDASGSSHRQSGGDARSGDEGSPPPISNTDAPRTAPLTRTARSAAIDYDA